MRLRRVLRLRVAILFGVVFGSVSAVGADKAAQIAPYRANSTTSNNTAPLKLKMRQVHANLERIR